MSAPRRVALTHVSSSSSTVEEKKKKKKKTKTAFQQSSSNQSIGQKVHADRAALQAKLLFDELRKERRKKGVTKSQQWHKFKKQWTRIGKELKAAARADNQDLFKDLEDKKATLQVKGNILHAVLKKHKKKHGDAGKHARSMSRVRKRVSRKKSSAADTARRKKRTRKTRDACAGFEIKSGKKGGKYIVNSSGRKIYLGKAKK